MKNFGNIMKNFGIIVKNFGNILKKTVLVLQNEECAKHFKWNCSCQTENLIVQTMLDRQQHLAEFTQFLNGAAHPTLRRSTLSVSE